MRYPNAAKGIKKIWIAEILSILAALLIAALVILVSANHVDTSISGEEAVQVLEAAKISGPIVVLGVGMMLLMLVSYFLNMAGIINASKDEAGFKRALWTLLASMAFGIVAAILENSNVKVANWLKIPSTLFELVVMIYVLEGIANLAALIRSYFAMDGHHIQFNVIDKETLIDAQKRPEEYKELIVRVAGYSDYFRNLDAKLQGEIIERTEQSFGCGC